MGIALAAAGTYRCVELHGVPRADAQRAAAAARKALANEVIEQLLVDAIPTTLPELGHQAPFRRIEVALRGKTTRTSPASRATAACRCRSSR
jgi:hypothetical protein